MKRILLTQGRVTLVDDKDYEYLNQWKWYFADGYAKKSEYLGGGAKNPIRKQTLMHRLVLKAGKNFVDHINRNTLDNRKCNLRIASRSQNAINRPKQANNTSNYKGVTYLKANKKWIAQIKINRKYYYLGSYKNPEEAARAYNEAAVKHYGEFAMINSIVVI